METDQLDLHAAASTWQQDTFVVDWLQSAAMFAAAVAVRIEQCKKAAKHELKAVNAAQ